MVSLRSGKPRARVQYQLKPITGYQEGRLVEVWRRGARGVTDCPWCGSSWAVAINVSADGGPLAYCYACGLEMEADAIGPYLPPRLRDRVAARLRNVFHLHVECDDLDAHARRRDAWNG